LRGKCLTIAIRLRDPAGGWRYPIFSKYGGHAQLVYNVFAAEPGGQIVVGVGGRQIGRVVRTFADVAAGEAGAFVGSAAYVELFCNQGHFAREWRVGPGDPVTLDRTTAA
jgi:S-adenosylmethionine hydrolase